MADYRVIQHINQVMCDRIQEICDGLELNWVGIHKDLDTAPKDDEEATVYCSLYRIDDMDDINMPGWPVKPEVMGASGPRPPDQRRQELVQLPPRFFYLYFILFVESPDADVSNALMGAIMNGFHQETTLFYRPVPFELNGRVFDSMGRSLASDGYRYVSDPTEEPAPGANDELLMERISVALVDDLAFGDACLLLKGFDRKVRPYLSYRVFSKIDQPLELRQKPGGVRFNLFDTEDR